MELVTVFTAFNRAEVDLVCARLEAAGFNPVVAHEYSSAALGSMISTVSPRVQVPADQAEEVLSFLADQNNTPET